MSPNLEGLLEFASTNEEIIVMGVIGVVAIFWIAIASFIQLIKNIMREKTRREIAAYIAEGSMTPEQGERLLVAGDSNDD